jgi:hypothetical protein
LQRGRPFFYRSLQGNVERRGDLDGVVTNAAPLPARSVQRRPLNTVGSERCTGRLSRSQLRRQVAGCPNRGTDFLSRSGALRVGRR